MVDRVCEKLDVSERRACRVLGQARSTQRRRPIIRDDEDASRCIPPKLRCGGLTLPILLLFRLISPFLFHCPLYDTGRHGDASIVPAK
jgi:hypothetical protein